MDSSTIAGKSLPRGVQDRLEDVALIFCLSWLRFGTLLGRFWHHFDWFWHPLFVDSGVDVGFFGPFSLTCGIDPSFFSCFRSSLPSYIHVSIFPFLFSYIPPFIPGSFIPPFIPGSFYPFFLPPCTHSSILPFILSSIGPFILSCLLPSTFHRSSPSSLHPFFPSSLGAFNPGPAACAKRLNK